MGIKGGGSIGGRGASGNCGKIISAIFKKKHEILSLKYFFNSNEIDVVFDVFFC